MDSIATKLESSGMVVTAPDLTRIASRVKELNERDRSYRMNEKTTFTVEQTAEEIKVDHRLGFRSLKRMTDIVVSLLGLICLSWLFLIIAILIKVEDHGPVFYKQKRIGKNGKEFYCYKFRTMIVDADHLERWLSPAELEEYERDRKLKHDPRITRIGKILRMTSLDELPQLVNTVTGSMSLVGPRPGVKEEVEAYGEYSKLLLSVKPGITGYWQVHGRSEVGFITPKAMELQIYYVMHCSIKLDIKILFRTISVVLSRKGAM